MNFALRGGPNYANLRGSSVTNNSAIVAFNASIAFDLGLEYVMKNNLGEHLSIQIEGGITQKGATMDFQTLIPHFDPTTNTTIYDVVPTITTEKQKATYLTIPVLLKYTMGDVRSRFKPNFYLGGYISGMYMYQVGNKTMRDFDGNENSEKRLYKNDYSGIDYGVIGGLGFTQKIGGRRTRWAVVGDVRYALGLLNMGEYKLNSKDFPVDFLADVKNNTFEISFGVSYQIK
jgi:hypothetical protein